MDASTYTQKKRTRQEYMNYVSNNQALIKNCITISNIKSGVSDPQDLALGGKYTSCKDYICALTNACGPRPRTEGNGAAYFSGSVSSYMTIPNDSDFQLGTEDFTIEWFIYGMPKNQSPRVFSIGSFPFASIAVSLEDGEIYLWTANNLFYMGNAEYDNNWVHMALVRQNGLFTFFCDGIAARNAQSIDVNLTSTDNLILGNESPYTNTANCLKGYITNFHWVKGAALYTSNFTPPTSPITPTPYTKLLLNMIGNQVTEDSSSEKKVVTASNVVWAPLSPFSPFAGLDPVIT